MKTSNGCAIGRTWFAAVSVAAAASVGCGAGEPGAEVWGQVICKGQPLTQGIVVLTPTSGKANTEGAGALDDHGRFVIQSSRADVDLIPGRYSISIRPPSYVTSWRETDETPPGYPVPVKFLDPGHPVLFVDLKAEPMRLDLTLRK